MSYVISKSFAFESFRLLLIERSCWLMYGMILRCLTPKWYSLCLLRSLWRCKSCRPAFSRVTLSSKNSSFSFLRYQSSSRMSKIFLLAFFEPTHWCDYFPWMWTQLRLSLTMWCRVQYCFRSKSLSVLLLGHLTNDEWEKRFYGELNNELMTIVTWSHSFFILIFTLIRCPSSAPSCTVCSQSRGSG